VKYCKRCGARIAHHEDQWIDGLLEPWCRWWNDAVTGERVTVYHEPKENDR
jgi:hypothetical protein